MFTTLNTDDMPWPVRAAIVLGIAIGSAWGAVAYFEPTTDLSPSQVRHVQEVARQEASLAASENRRLMEKNSALLQQISDRLSRIEGQLDRAAPSRHR